MRSLTGNTVIITGASSGLGFKLTERFLKENLNVVALGRNVSELKKLKEKNKNLHIQKIDLLDDTKTTELIDYLCREIKTVDIIIHSAGIFHQGSIYTQSVEEFDRQFKLNTRIPYVLTQKLLKKLNKDFSQIVFLNSSAGISTKEGISQYSASKYGLRALSDSFRDELNKNNIRIIGVYPGRMATPMQKKILEDEGEKYDELYLINPNDVVEMILSALKTSSASEVTDIHIRPFKKLK